MMHDFRDADILAKSVSFFMLQCSLAERLNTLLSQIKAAAVTYLWPFPGFSRLNAARCIEPPDRFLVVFRVGYHLLHDSMLRFHVKTTICCIEVEQ